jgi:predicted RNA-binding Zn-ribbon protein involved in translation (DUF1610 family)
MRRLVEEDPGAPTAALRTYAAAVLLGSAAIRLMTRRSGFWEGIALCGLGLIPLAYCYYYVAPTHEILRRGFRIRLSAVAALGCGILLSHPGLRVRSLDLVNAVVFALVGGIVTHLIILLVGSLVDALFGRIRRFMNPAECRTCGYDLTGNTSGLCPECGSSVPLYQCNRRTIVRGPAAPE